MKKIISLFQRNYDGDRLVRNEVVPGAEWVIAGEGQPTRKFDGTCCLVRDGKLFKRYEVKPGAKPPPNFEPANEIDESTGKQQGWLPVGDGPDDKWHRQAFNNQNFYEGDRLHSLHDGTFELCGPKVQGNPEREYVESEVGQDMHLLIAHGYYVLCDVPRNFDALKDYLSRASIEGIVWHHPDGRMVKIKAKDFRD
jgi:hypothetical protein